MGIDMPEEQIASQSERILGYLNFSSGAEDLTVLAQLNELFAWLQGNAPPDDSTPVWKRLQRHLEQHLSRLSESSTALRDSQQAARVIALTFEHVLPVYYEHHRDLLFHKTAEQLFNAFFIGRIFEVVLQLQGSNDDPVSLALLAIDQLNDYIGHRPVATLESRKLEPYEHEWVRPIPLYVRGAGVIFGEQAEVIQSAIDHLSSTNSDIRFSAHFDPELLDELALDPRSFDFDHPINKRPNYHFGQWDERHIDGKGHFRRFVIHGVTLESLCRRVWENKGDIPHDQLVYEAGAVLAGTILMSSGISGWGPGAYDSTVTLNLLLPKIARYRDEFYEDLLARTPAEHQKRLVEEAELRQQPFGAARQHLNLELANYRAFQMIHVHLSLVFARMGYDGSAMQHVDVLPVASTRMACQLECMLYTGNQSLESGDLATACNALPRLFDLLLRAIDCGALIDPWNIIGFDANYELFHGTGNTVHDHRAEQLIELVEQLFCFASAIWIAAKANDQPDISARVQHEFREICDWWFQFATHEVGSIESFDANEVYAATGKVAELIGQWQKAGSEQGDLEFWAGHASAFDTDREYVLAINSLIDREDYSTSMALLIHWLGSRMPETAVQSINAFQSLTTTWLTRQTGQLENTTDDSEWARLAIATWNRVRKFCDYAEANAGDLWSVPQFSLQSPVNVDDEDSDEEPGELEIDGEDERFLSAYEDMVFRETSDDGFEGAIFEDGDQAGYELQDELESILENLKFIDIIVACRAEATLLINDLLTKCDSEESRKVVTAAAPTISNWFQQASDNCDSLEKLIESIDQFTLSVTTGSTESLGEYDRQRLFKETLLDHVMHAYVETSAARFLMGSTIFRLSIDPREFLAEFDKETVFWIRSIGALLSSDRSVIRELMPSFLELLVDLPLLYVPLSRGGNPKRIAQVRVRQAMIGQLLDCLPRIGLFTETRAVLHTALTMERNQSVRQGAVTEFDELFQIGFTSMVNSLVRAARNTGGCGPQPADDSLSIDRLKSPEGAENQLFETLESLAESMLMLWLGHSQTLRLSVLEKVREDSAWNSLVEFIDQFGETIFTQQFLNLSNIRAILHQGVDTWLSQLEDEEDEETCGWHVIEKIRAGYPRREAIRHLTLVLESVIENFNEYRDYNCTTTQSDNGRQLHFLLDFLRLRCRYDQVAWNLKPVMWAHETLVRNGYRRVARLWRKLLAERVESEADRLLLNLHQLQDKYSIQMASVSQRLNEKFLHPMQVDRLLSLVRTAIKDPSQHESQRAFELIEHYAESLMRMPAGAGLDVPNWLQALEQEVDQAISSVDFDRRDDGMIGYDLPGIGELLRQLDELPKRVP